MLCFGELRAKLYIVAGKRAGVWLRAFFEHLKISEIIPCVFYISEEIGVRLQFLTDALCFR